MITKFFAFAFFIFVLISGCTQSAEDYDSNQAGLILGEKTVAWSAKTDDGIQLKGNYFSAESQKGVVLVHMLGRNKETWNGFAKELQKNGFNVLAIDLRGHGESGGGNHSFFSAQQWNAAANDIKAAVNFLKEQNQEVFLAGASIGANLVLKYAAEDSSIQKIVLLSPGLDYKGVMTKQAMQNYGDRAILIAASKEDSYAFSSSNELFELASGEKEFKRLENKGHGTNMLENSDLSRLIIAWFNS